MIGEEFKTARKHLLALMPGDAAFKRGRPQRKAETGANIETTNLETGVENTTRPEHFEQALA